MEQKFSNLGGIMEAANHSKNSALEAENQVKHGASLKNEVSTRRHLVLLVFIFVTTLSFAQSNLQDVVYLKNGSIIRGIIGEINPNQPVRIETADRNVFVFKWDEIEKITKEPQPGNVTAPQNNQRIQPDVGKQPQIQYDEDDDVWNNEGLKRGYKGIAELGGAFFFDGYFGLRATYINAYQFNPYISLGIGTGFITCSYQGGIPIFVDFRINFLNSRISPYFAAEAGYSIFQGFLVNPTAGVTFMVRNKSAINVGVGYLGQQIWWEEYWSYGDGRAGKYDYYLRFMSSLNLVVSFSF